MTEPNPKPRANWDEIVALVGAAVVLGLGLAGLFLLGMRLR